MKGFGENNKSKKINRSYSLHKYDENKILNEAIKYHYEGNLIQAGRLYKFLVEKGSNNSTVYTNYGLISINKGKLKEAEFLIRKAIQLNPQDSIAHSNLGGLLKDKKKLKEAEKSLTKAIQLNPQDSIAHSNLGSVLKDLGKLEEAEKSLLKAIEINPNFASAYFLLSTFRASTKNKDWQKYLFSPRILNNQKDINLIDIYFARANILEKNLEYTESSNMLIKANILNRKIYSSDYMRMKEKMKYYSKIWRNFKNKNEVQENQPVSIFIVGLPRSGKTITESILACNKSVLQCGEDKALSIAVNKYLNPKENQNNQDLYQIYIANIKKEISGKSFICSTMPNNFIYTGLIANQIPNSKIVYCFRNPLDNIKELYFHNIKNQFSFRSSVVESANILLSIDELMEEYRKIFSSKIFFLNYDEIILNPEQEIKSLVSWLGWEYEEKYLNPKLDPTTYIRSDKQNSFLNKKHQNTWKHYKDLLKPAIEVFEERGKYQNLIS